MASAPSSVIQTESSAFSVRAGDVLAFAVMDIARRAAACRPPDSALRRNSVHLQALFAPFSPKAKEPPDRSGGSFQFIG